MAFIGLIGPSIRPTTTSKDLYENINYIIDDEKSNLSLFGSYSLKNLKKRKILHSMDRQKVFEFLKNVEGISPFTEL